MNSNTCKACGQELPQKRGRRCSACQQPIGKGHKYEFIGGTVRHKDCANPTLATEPRQDEPRLVEVPE